MKSIFNPALLEQSASSIIMPSHQKQGYESNQKRGIKFEESKLVNILHSTPTELFSANKILYHLKPKNNMLEYYLPAYFQLNFDSISEIDYQSLNAKCSCTIQFIVNVHGLDWFIVDHLKRSIRLFSHHDKIINLDLEMIENYQFGEKEQDELPPQIQFQQMKEYQSGNITRHYLMYSIRKQFITGIVPDVNYTPFELLHLNITLHPKVTKNIDIKELIREYFPKNIVQWMSPQLKQEINKSHKKLQGICFQFNLMDCPSCKANTICYKVGKSFGNYKIAVNQLSSQFTHESVPAILRSKQKKKKNKKLKLQGYEKAHFIIPVYKIPNSGIVTIFVPLLLLSIINITIFTNEFDISTRIASISSLFLAFVSIFPVIRSQIPPNPSITFIQKLVYLLASTDIICLVESVYEITGNTDNPSEPKSLYTLIENKNIFFLLSLGITCFVFFIILILLFIHKYKWQPQYLGKGEKFNVPMERFDHKKWKNQQCDENFIKFVELKQVFQIKRDNQQMK